MILACLVLMLIQAIYAKTVLINVFIVMALTNAMLVRIHFTIHQMGLANHAVYIVLLAILKVAKYVILDM